MSPDEARQTLTAASDLEIVATARTVEEAEVIRVRLGAEGIEAFIPNAATTSWYPHMSLAINPNGVAVMVRAEQAGRAREALLAGETNQARRGEAAVETDADTWARRAAHSALFTWLFPPVAFWALYCVGRAAHARKLHPPGDPDVYSRNMFCAVLLAPLLAGAAAYALYAALSSIF